MRQISFALAVFLCPLTVSAQGNQTVETIVTDHILPSFARLADRSNILAITANADCTADSQQLRTAYTNAFDAWVSASHLRFGPTEVDDRAFALAFWPDSRGATPKSLTALIADQDPIAANIDEYANVSIAARGFYALEFLLYDDALSTFGDDSFRCTLIQTVAADISMMATAISQNWVDDYAARLLVPSADGLYRSDDEVLQQMLKALSTGLQFTAETRLGRPLGTFDAPRPTRAEAWRSGRSADHVDLSLRALRDLAIMLAADDDALVDELSAAFDRALAQLAELDDPIFADVADPQARFKVEVVQSSIEIIRTLVTVKLGPKLGVSAGFNALDGD